ncbi:hypothetical protein UFOVP447_56 [uncultured Caudovirales phage]|uniref:Uncharacterized protein n=1 Tax=uncultured Caudovirales phage TaxID=2100421 RepID=A0A6J5MGW9_9CAUD|nr:hypothetical protein UFOVP447_56 [uncultured Caudovirales phage]
MTDIVENEAAQPVAANPSVTLEVNVNELNVIIGALQELPHRVVDGLLRKLIDSAKAQLQA